MKRILLVLISLIMILNLIGCSSYKSVETSHEITAQANEEAIKNIMKNDDIPKIARSLERENIKRRIEFINQPDRIGYLYLLTETGQLIKEVQVLGKVSSLNSYLTPMEDIQLLDGRGNYYELGEFPYSTKNPHFIVTEAADLDGTYGENAEGIFWFTDDGVYQEWSGMYFYSSDRMTFTTHPILMEVID